MNIRVAANLNAFGANPDGHESATFPYLDATFRRGPSDYIRASFTDAVATDSTVLLPREARARIEPSAYGLACGNTMLECRSGALSEDPNPDGPERRAAMIDRLIAQHRLNRTGLQSWIDHADRENLLKIPGSSEQPIHLNEVSIHTTRCEREQDAGSSVP